MQFFNNLSIGQKLIGSFIIILLILIFQSLTSKFSLSRLNDDITKIVNINQPASLQATQLSATLRESSRALGFYIITQKETDKGLYQTAVETLQTQLNALKQLPAISQNVAYSKRLDDISALVEQTQVTQNKLITMAVDPNSNMPAMFFSAENINPQYRTKLQLLSTMLESELEEEASPDRKQLNNAIVALRYYWTTINNELRLFLAFRTKVAIENLKIYEEVAKNKHAELMALSDLFTFEQIDAMEQFNDGLETYWLNLHKLIEIHLAEDWRGDAHLLRTEVAPALKKIDASITALVDLLEKDSQLAAEDAAQLFETKNTQNILIIFIALGILGVMAWWLTRGITVPIKQAVNIAKQIANGNLNNKISISSRDEAGKMLASLDKMQIDLRERIEADAKTAAENLRIRQALDNVSVSVTVSNEENKLIYINKAAGELAKTLEKGIQTKHPDYSAQNMIGKNISSYLDDPQVKTAYQQALKKTEQYNTVVAGRNLRMIANPVLDANGTYQGRVTQWEDITESLRAAEKEKKRIEEERKIAAENLRIRTALDNVSSNVMLADTDRNIIYMNKNAQKLFTETQNTISQHLPGFDPENLLGSNIDVFHKHPAHQQQLLDNLNSTYQSEINIGDMTMKIITNPVVNEQGERLGTAVEWSNRTQEVAVEKEIDQLVESARNGDLSGRIDISNKNGFFKQLGNGFNALLDELASVFDDIALTMSKVANGDLTHTIDKNYRGTFGSVKDDINKTINNLSGVLASLMNAAESINSTSGEISSGNTNLSSRTEQQAASLEETASSMEQLTSTVRNNADNAQQANQVFMSARHSAEKGGTVVSDAINAMNEISTASDKIAEIIGVIDDIAFQTNLLALNASVEAARAGEQGRGFAVVATEVRNLASRSAEAAKQIKTLIQDSVDKVQSGTELVNQSGHTLEAIVTEVKKVSDIVAEIAAASAEQSQGIDQVNAAVTAMDELTQQNAALAEQTSAASANMSERAEEMKNKVSFFRVN